MSVRALGALVGLTAATAAPVLGKVRLVGHGAGGAGASCAMSRTYGEVVGTESESTTWMRYEPPPPFETTLTLSSAVPALSEMPATTFEPRRDWSIGTSCTPAGASESVACVIVCCGSSTGAESIGAESIGDESIGALRSCWPDGAYTIRSLSFVRWLSVIVETVPAAGTGSAYQSVSPCVCSKER